MLRLHTSRLCRAASAANQRSASSWLAASSYTSIWLRPSSSWGQRRQEDSHCVACGRCKYIYRPLLTSCSTVCTAACCLRTASCCLWACTARG